MNMPIPIVVNVDAFAIRINNMPKTRYTYTQCRASHSE